MTKTVIDREQLELEKLKLEVEALQRPLHKSSAFWLGALSVLLALIGVVAQGYLTRIETANARAEMENARKIKADAEVAVQGLNEEKNQLTQDVAALRQEAENLRQANVTLGEISRSTELSEEQERRVTSAENARYSIGIYGFDVEESIYNDVREWISEQGYTVSQSALLETRPSWLASTPTVLHYDESSKLLASEIAKSLTNITGLEFNVQRGAGLGVIEGEEPWSYFIHVVGS